MSFPSPCFSPEPQILGTHGLLDTSPWTFPRLLPRTGSHTGLSVSLNVSFFPGPHVRAIPTVTQSFSRSQHGHCSPFPSHPVTCLLVSRGALPSAPSLVCLSCPFLPLGPHPQCPLLIHPPQGGQGNLPKAKPDPDPSLLRTLQNSAVPSEAES